MGKEIYQFSVGNGTLFPLVVDYLRLYCLDEYQENVSNTVCLKKRQQIKKLKEFFCFSFFTRLPKDCFFSFFIQIFYWIHDQKHDQLVNDYEKIIFNFFVNA